MCTFDHLFVRLRCVWAFVCFELTRLAAHFSAVHSVFYCFGRGHLSPTKTPIEVWKYIKHSEGRNSFASFDIL